MDKQIKQIIVAFGDSITQAVAQLPERRWCCPHEKVHPDYQKMIFLLKKMNLSS
jgi:hypothetical protein